MGAECLHDVSLLLVGNIGIVLGSVKNEKHPEAEPGEGHDPDDVKYPFPPEVGDYHTRNRERDHRSCMRTYGIPKSINQEKWPFALREDKKPIENSIIRVVYVTSLLYLTRFGH